MCPGHRSSAVVGFSAAALLFSLTPNPACAAPLDWDGSTGNWNTDASWLPGGAEPTAGDDASIDAGAVTVSLAGEVADIVRVGLTGGGSLRVQAGGALTNTTGYVGTSAGSVASATVTGTGSVWTNTGNLSVGNSGTGSLNIVAGGTVSSFDGFIGVNAGGSGDATITGAGSAWSTNGLYVGYFGDGTLDVEDDGTVNAEFIYIARRPGSTGSVSVIGNGTNLNSSVGVRLGSSGSTGQLSTSAGASVFIGDAAPNYADDSYIIISDADATGDYTGSLLINAGSTVTHAGTAFLGYGASEFGTATISGAGALWTNSVSMVIGREGSGTLNIVDGGSVQLGFNLSMQTIGGNAALNFSIASLADPFLDVAGDANLAGTLGVALNPNFTLTEGDSFTLIDIGGNQSGSFSNYAQNDLLGTFNGVDLFLSYTGGDGNDVVAYASTGSGPIAREWIGGSPSGPPFLYHDSANWDGGAVPDADDPFDAYIPAEITWNATTGNTASGSIFASDGLTFSSVGGPFTHTVNGDLERGIGLLTIENMTVQVNGDFSTGSQSGGVLLQGQSQLIADTLHLNFEADEMEVDGPDASVTVLTETVIIGGQYSGLVFKNGSIGNSLGDLTISNAAISSRGLEVLGGSKVSIGDLEVNSDPVDAENWGVQIVVDGTGSEIVQTGASSFTLGDGNDGSPENTPLEDAILLIQNGGRVTTGTGAVTIQSDATVEMNGGNLDVYGPLTVNGRITIDGTAIGGVITAHDDVTINGGIAYQSLSMMGDNLIVNGFLRGTSSRFDIVSDIVVNGSFVFNYSGPGTELDWAPGKTLAIEGSGYFEIYLLAYTTPVDSTIVLNGDTSGDVQVDVENITLSDGSRFVINQGVASASFFAVDGEGAELIVSGPNAKLKRYNYGSISKISVPHGLVRFENDGNNSMHGIELYGSDESILEVLAGTSIGFDYLIMNDTASVLVSGDGASLSILDSTSLDGLVQVNSKATLNLYDWPQEVDVSQIAPSGVMEIASEATFLANLGLDVHGNYLIRSGDTVNTIEGDLTFRSTSRFGFGIDSATPNALSMPDGTTSLDIESSAELAVEITTTYDVYRPAAGNLFVLIDGEGSRTGTFDLVTTPADDGIEWQLLYLAKPGGGFQVAALAAVVYQPADTDGDGDIDDSDLGLTFANYTGPLAAGGDKHFGDGDTDGDGDIDDADLGSAFAAYTGPLSPSVPEPNTLALLGMAGMALASRRR